jgi:hypothetical protein
VYAKAWGERQAANQRPSTVEQTQRTLGDSVAASLVDRSTPP